MSEAGDDRPSLIVLLRDGSEALIRPVTPLDRDLFVQGLEGLSTQSRRTRFGASISRLTERELAYLTQVDQKTHVAWGATIDSSAAGVGRYILVPGEERAEVAVTVVDRYQRRGLGRTLFEALVAVARSDGVVELFFEVQPDNEPALRGLQGVEVRYEPAESMFQGMVQIEGVPVSSRETEFVEVMTRFRQTLRQDQAPERGS